MNPQTKIDFSSLPFSDQVILSGQFFVTFGTALLSIAQILKLLENGQLTTRPISLPVDDEQVSLNDHQRPYKGKRSYFDP